LLPDSKKQSQQRKAERPEQRRTEDAHGFCRSIQQQNE
jgi:hypothetical protein